MFPISNHKMDNSEAIYCPICGYEEELYTHLESINQYYEKDGRLCVKLNFYCESGHKFSIDFHQHEGITYLKTSKISENYYDYIGSDEWKEKRNEVISQKGAKCSICGNIHDLRVHHLSYDNLYKEEENNFEDLIVLCDSCHKNLHKFIDNNKSVFEKMKENINTIYLKHYNDFKEEVETAIFESIKDIFDNTNKKHSLIIPYIKSILGLNNFRDEIQIYISAQNLYCRLKNEGKLE